MLDQELENEEMSNDNEDYFYSYGTDTRIKFLLEDEIEMLTSGLIKKYGREYLFSKLKELYGVYQQASNNIISVNDCNNIYYYNHYIEFYHTLKSNIHISFIDVFLKIYLIK